MHRNSNFKHNVYDANSMCIRWIIILAICFTLHLNWIQ